MEKNIKKIIFINRFFYPDYSATSQILSDLAFHLSSIGFPVTVITSLGLYNEKNIVLKPFEIINGVQIYRVGSCRSNRERIFWRALNYLKLYVLFSFKLFKISNDGDVVIVKTDPPLLSIVLMPVSRMKRLMQINWLQDLYPEVAIELGFGIIRPFASILKLMRNVSLKSATNVVIGHKMMAHLMRDFKSRLKILIIPNWCDDKSIVPVSVSQNCLRKEWDLSDRFVIGYSGNLGRAHEYMTIIEAAEQLREEKNIVFLFIGGGALMRSLKREVVQRRLNDMFIFKPYQDFSILSHSLSVSDVHWVSLSNSMEGLIVPSKIYGIAAVGRPILAIGDPGGEVGSLVSKYECGIAIEVGKSEELAQCILNLMNKPESVKIMGDNARKMLDKNFSKQLAMNKWTNLIDESLKK